MELDRNLTARATKLAAELQDTVTVYQCGVHLFNQTGSQDIEKMAEDAKAKLSRLITTPEAPDSAQ